MNNCILAPSECSSSGCESGWTSYLENSYISTYNYIGNNDNNEFLEKGNMKMKEEEEEEDLSMVSDASSGPPHVHEHESGPPHVHEHEYYSPTISQGAALPKKSGKRDKEREPQRNKIQKQPSLLDDTASSPLLDFSNNNAINYQASRPSMLDFSQGHSTTHFQGGSTYPEHYGIYYPSISPAGNHQQHDQWYEEKRW
ncbi:hypothetical protein Leryth_004287 [Lithospermum erythrorhizon]|uniref:Uncharacterized protein n=1 Tax=Lithospermum erythrorhizon TaxID=34254 RepID=A0AAV3Q0J4_LITER|nr:hypothetical protein Leryth_004287 [Lithospermum erythrorhizon]